MVVEAVFYFFVSAGVSLVLFYLTESPLTPSEQPNAVKRFAFNAFRAAVIAGPAFLGGTLLIAVVRMGFGG